MLTRCVVLLWAVVAGSTRACNSHKWPLPPINNWTQLRIGLQAHGFNLGPSDVVFHLFTRANPTASQPLLPNPNSIATSSFSLQRRTIFTIHSYTEVVSGNFNAHLVPAHLAAEDVNLIAVDWGRGSTTYSIGLANSPQVGQVIATFINILTVDFTYNVDLIRIVGVGLGAHIAGIAARRATGVIPHVVALDPSLVGWTHHPDKLSTNDATSVEVLYATAGVYGYDYPLGHLNFFANGGVRQAGCGTDISCSHIFSYIFYAESITTEVTHGNRFVGTACADHVQALANVCAGPRGAVFGGTDTKKGVTGIYTFNTNFQPPFAQG